MKKPLVMKKITSNYKLQEREKLLLLKLLDDETDLKRIDEILDFIIELKLDKSSVFGFLAYQLYKVNPVKAESLKSELTKDEEQIFERFKSLKDLRYLNRAEEAEDIRMMFIGLGKDLRVVIIKLAGILYDVKHLKEPLS